MRILLLTDDMQPGGVAKHVVDLANGLRTRDIDVLVAATDGPFRLRLPDDIRFIPLALVHGDSFRKDVLGTAKSLVSLIRLIREESITIIHSHKRFADFLGRILARFGGCYHVSSCHNTFDDLQWFSKFGHYTIACSRSVETMLLHPYGRKRVQLIYCGLIPFREYTEEEKKNVRERFRFPEHVQIIASVGHLSSDKDRTTLLEALHLLDEMEGVPEMLCVIVGDGEQRDMLLKTCTELGLQRKVRFLGALTDVEALLNVSEFGCISSVRDGGVLYVILEAASLGKPFVATNVGGIPEFVIPGETGILVPPRNPRALADGILRLLKDKQMVTYLGASAKKRYQEVHGLDHFLDQVLAVYKRVIAGS